MTWREDVDYVVTERNDDGSARSVKPIPDPDWKRRFVMAVCTGDTRHLDRERWPGELRR